MIKMLRIKRVHWTLQKCIHIQSPLPLIHLNKEHNVKSEYLYWYLVVVLNEPGIDDELSRLHQNVTEKTHPENISLEHHDVYNPKKKI